ncbi:MAG: hypothetical protein HOV97_01350, partial [Nonomuraea sp.]|nr:hypothetical protein [Nonomuraea sp.]
MTDGTSGRGPSGRGTGRVAGRRAGLGVAGVVGVLVLAEVAGRAGVVDPAVLPYASTEIGR